MSQGFSVFESAAMLLHHILARPPPFYTCMGRSEFRKLTERVTYNLFERCTFNKEAADVVQVRAGLDPRCCL